MPGLDVSKIPVDLLLNILNIVLLFVIVRALAYKPVKKFMENRTARVNAAAEEAAAKAAEADKAKADYEALLADAQAEKAKVVEEARKQAKAEAQAIVTDARNQADSIVTAAQAQAQKTHDEALQNMQGEVVALAFDISEKLLERTVQDADTKKMADRLFDSHMNGGVKE